MPDTAGLEPLSVLAGRVGHVHLQVGLTQSLAGAVGERGHAVGAEPQQRSDVGGFLALHLEVPQDQLPALGQ